MVPDLQTFLLICAVLLWAGAQYGLMVWAVRDLVRRPSVRGGNKIVWGIVILTIPIFGPIAYAMIAPLTTAPSPPRFVVPRRSLMTHDDAL